MKANDIFRRNGDILRILEIRDGRCLCINCNAACMPVWILMDEIEECANDVEPVIDGCCYQYVSCPWNAQGERFGTSCLVYLDCFSYIKVDMTFSDIRFFTYSEIIKCYRKHGVVSLQEEPI